MGEKRVNWEIPRSNRCGWPWVVWGKSLWVVITGAGREGERYGDVGDGHEDAMRKESERREEKKKKV